MFQFWKILHKMSKIFHNNFEKLSRKFQNIPENLKKLKNFKNFP
jgi:predicted transcriptional regulator